MRPWFFLAAGLTLTAACAGAPTPGGRQLFTDNCAACHGANARGDGPLAEGLEIAPPDLRQITARNDGVFPRVQVLSTIDGYTRTIRHETAMPEFGVLLDGPIVLYETAPGVMTPTPQPLVALTTYLEAIQD